jgi:hypothetical protein
MKVLGSSKFSPKVKRRREGEGEGVPCLDNVRGMASTPYSTTTDAEIQIRKFSKTIPAFMLLLPNPMLSPLKNPAQESSNASFDSFILYTYQNIGEYQWRNQE